MKKAPLEGCETLDDSEKSPLARGNNAFPSAELRKFLSFVARFGNPQRMSRNGNDSAT
jgi:hypothetical protein